MATTYRPTASADQSGLHLPLPWLWRQVASFEMLFALYFFSNRFQPLLPELPIDSTLVFAALSIPAGAWIIHKEGLYTRGLPMLAAMLVFLLWVVITFSWSPGRSLATYSIAYMGTFDMLNLGIGAFVLASRRDRAVRFLLLLLGFSLFFAVYGIAIVVIYGSFRRLFGVFEAERMYLNWGYGVTAGGIVAFCMALYSRPGSMRQVGAAILFGIIGYFLLVSSARGPFLAVAVACMVPFVIAWPLARRGRIHVEVSLVVGAIGVICAVAYLSFLIASGQTFHTLDRFSKLLAESESTTLVQGPNRFRYWAAAWAFWLESPVVGNGVGSFSRMFWDREVQGAHPHNIVLELLTHYGLVGFGLFALVIWLAVRHISVARLREDRLMLCVFLLFTARLTAAMWNTELPNQEELFLFMGMLMLRPPPEVPTRRH